MLYVPQDIPRYATNAEPTPVYMQDWFMRITAKGTDTLRVAAVQGGDVVGAFMVSCYRNPLGMKQAYNLPWARVSGPIIDETVGPRRRSQITRELVDRLPRSRSYFLTLSNEHDFNAFLASGFEGEMEENFEIPPERAAGWEGRLSDMARRHVRRANEKLDVSTLDAAKFVRVYAGHLAERKRKPYSELSIARDILAEATRRGQAKITVARQRDSGEIDAAIACLWDDEKYYYWMTTRRPPGPGRAAPHQGAVKLLLYSAIKDAHRKGLTFDFDGVTSGSVAQLYAAMGGIKSVRYKVKRLTPCERLACFFRPRVKSMLRNSIGKLVALKSNR